MDFYRYHGLGNDYLEIDPAKTDIPMTPETIRLIDSEVTVHMAGGELWVKIGTDYAIEQEGPVRV